MRRTHESGTDQGVHAASHLFNIQTDFSAVWSAAQCCGCHADVRQQGHHVLKGRYYRCFMHGKSMHSSRMIASTCSEHCNSVSVYNLWHFKMPVHAGGCLYTSDRDAAGC